MCYYINSFYSYCQIEYDIVQRVVITNCTVYLAVSVVWHCCSWWK